jgi:hypothetical protein
VHDPLTVANGIIGATGHSTASIEVHIAMKFLYNYRVKSFNGFKFVCIFLILKQIITDIYSDSKVHPANCNE